MTFRKKHLLILLAMVFSITTIAQKEEKAICGIYTWITANISYDVENMYRIKYDIKPGELAEKTFITRKAVCQGYSELFNELCQEAGITSFVVNGYTKQNGEISSMGHAWVVGIFLKGDLKNTFLPIITW